MNSINNINFKRKTNEHTRFDDVLNYIDIEIRQILKNISFVDKESFEEIRLRVNQPLILCKGAIDYFVDKNSILHSSFNEDAYIVSKEEVYKTFQFCCNHSIYAHEEDIKRGFITLKSGHRVGLVGSAIYSNNMVETIKDITSLNIRISKEIIGASDKILPYVIKDDKTIYHTLIVSPPKCGKTTILRDLIRNISDGVGSINFKGLRVGVLDERMEISGVHKGIAQMNLGVRTDILSSCPKYEGIMMLIRSMSPQVIATDELGSKSDIDAIHEALKAGVKLVATVHGESLEDVMNKPYLNQIIKENIFQKIIILDNSKGVGTVKKIINLAHNQYIKKKEKYNVDNKNIRQPDGSYIL
ncbi:stage III sporulation protein AA [Clostridiaceae bacterium M8S5]|nr:stage III sporulation protein AA [Clostridiaceae bacterium M8S5]